MDLIAGHLDGFSSFLLVAARATRSGVGAATAAANTEHRVPDGLGIRCPEDDLLEPDSVVSLMGTRGVAAVAVWVTGWAPARLDSAAVRVLGLGLSLGGGLLHAHELAHVGGVHV